MGIGVEGGSRKEKLVVIVVLRVCCSSGFRRMCVCVCLHVCFCCKSDTANEVSATRLVFSWVVARHLCWGNASVVCSIIEGAAVPRRRQETLAHIDQDIENGLLHSWEQVFLCRWVGVEARQRVGKVINRACSQNVRNGHVEFACIATPWHVSELLYSTFPPQVTVLVVGPGR